MGNEKSTERQSACYCLSKTAQMDKEELDMQAEKMKFEFSKLESNKEFKLSSEERMELKSTQRHKVVRIKEEKTPKNKISFPKLKNNSKASNQGKKKIKKLKSIPERFKHLYEFYKAFKFESMFEADFMEKDDYFQEMQRQSRLNHSKRLDFDGDKKLKTIGAPGHAGGARDSVQAMEITKQPFQDLPGEMLDIPELPHDVRIGPLSVVSISHASSKHHAKNYPIIMETNEDSTQKEQDLDYQEDEGPEKEFYRFSDGSLFIGHLTTAHLSFSGTYTNQIIKESLMFGTEMQNRQDRLEKSPKAKNNQPQSSRIKNGFGPQNEKNLPLKLTKSLVPNQVIELPDEALRNGPGIQIWKSGAVYEGFWFCDKFHGKGRFYDSHGNLYEGNWVGGVLNGKGKYIGVDGSSYIGQFRNDLQDGDGFESWADGTTYMGSFKQGMKHGEGDFRLACGDSYDGNFFKDKFHGRGRFYYSDGREYDGEFKANKMHGEGTFRWSDGRTYTGEYKDNLKNGKGVFTWPGGKRYEGTWKDSLQHGQGKLYQGNRLIRQGTWDNGAFVGRILNSE